MPSPNLPQLSPRAGNGLGGIPKKSDGLSAPETIMILLPYADSGNKTIDVPQGYKKIRVSIIGRGNNGSGTVSGGTYTNVGGAGGNCCISKTVDVIPGETVRYTESTQSIKYGSLVDMTVGAKSTSGDTPVPSGGDRIYFGGPGARYVGSSSSNSNEVCGGGGASFFGSGTSGSLGGPPGQNGPLGVEGRASRPATQASTPDGFGIGYGSRGNAGDAGPGVIRIELWA